MIPAASVTNVRAHFPALVRAHAGEAVAYFDGPGGTQVPTLVVNAMREYLLHHNGNTHWVFATSVETDQAIHAARGALADFLNAEPGEIAFGANMTTLTFHLARALGRGWGPDDEIIVTELDHHANIAPWQALARERGVSIRTVPMDVENFTIDRAALESAFSSRTRLLAIGAASNALGTITDVAVPPRLAREAGAMTFVDAVHYAPHQLVDVKRIGCDFLACSAYKFYGPHIGVLYGRRDAMERLDVPKLEPAPDTAPERLETGTQNHEGMVGAAAAVDFLASLGVGNSRRERLTSAFAALHERGMRLVGMLMDGLRGINGIRVYGVPATAARTPTVAFTVEGHTSQAVAGALAALGIFVSNGDFYATTVVERLGLGADGLVRAGIACYTTDRDVSRMVNAVRAIRK